MKLSDDIFGKIKNNTSIEQSVSIQKSLLEINRMFNDLKELQDRCEGGIGIWNLRKIDGKLKIQRREDLDNIRKHIDYLKEYSRGKKVLNIDRKETELIDLSKETKLNIDISYGIKQMEENKEMINEGINEIIIQVDKLYNKSKEFGDELQKQNVMTEKMEVDVNKYQFQLGTLNKRMGDMLDKIGVCKIISFIIIMILLLGFTGMGLFIISK